MKKDKKYYLNQYAQLVEQAIKEADEHYDTFNAEKERRDYGEWISEAEGCANAEEVVGYYLETYPEDYWEKWKENTDHIQKTAQDNEVYSILEGLWREDDGTKQNI